MISPRNAQDSERGEKLQAQIDALQDVDDWDSYEHGDYDAVNSLEYLLMKLAGEVTN